MSAQPKFPDSFRAIAMSVLAEQAKTEAIEIVNGLERRQTPMVVAEFALLIAAVSASVRHIVEEANGNEDRIAEQRANWLTAITETLDRGLSIHKTKNAETPQMPKELEQLLATLRDDSASDQAKREVLSAAVQGEECPGCGEVHELDEEEREAFEGLLSELDGKKPTLN
jgi:hypothetical protein